MKALLISLSLLLCVPCAAAAQVQLTSQATQSRSTAIKTYGEAKDLDLAANAAKNNDVLPLLIMANAKVILMPPEHPKKKEAQKLIADANLFLDYADKLRSGPDDTKITCNNTLRSETDGLINAADALPQAQATQKIEKYIMANNLALKWKEQAGIRNMCMVATIEVCKQAIEISKTPPMYPQYPPMPPSP